jgi:hypothetical protein
MKSHHIWQPQPFGHCFLDRDQTPDQLERMGQEELVVESGTQRQADSETPKQFVK